MKTLADNGKLSTRQVILEAIKEANEATVEELAQAAEVSPVTVRHHLNSLQADGLLETRSVRRKVGRPYFVYSLSDKGQELFPQRYLHLSSRLLDELKDRYPPEVVADLLTSVGDRVIDERRGHFEQLDFEQRLNFLVKLLSDEGFRASWEATAEGGYRLTEYSCPYFSIGQRHSEVCLFDRQLIQIVLDTAVERESCVLFGDSCCQFAVTVPDRAN
ncbi:MAG: helix-turn-helix transcriptional regulator [Candidatus Promineifilaceae bacterium]